MTSNLGAPPSIRDTIFALASGAGRAGIAVVRVSGPKADEALGRHTARPLPTERRAVLRSVLDSSTGDRIDDALVVRFSGPHSYTGENVVEFYIHGGRAVIDALLNTLCSTPGLRLAEPGEFTRQAVENGRLDLTQAEAVADLVNAETDAQRRSALRQLDGRLGALYEDWRSRLIRGAAWIEASIDFADEEIPPEALRQSRLSLAAVQGEIRAHLNDGRKGEILRDGFHVAVIGPPNAGKSSLVNALAKRDVAIVSDVPGTTRDVIEARLDLKGYPVILADTAGLREPLDAIEREGVRRARARAQSADLRLLVCDGSSEAPGENFSAEIAVWNKADLVQERNRTGLWVSAQTGEGLEALIDLLASRASEALDAGESPVLTRHRHRQALEEAERNLTAGLGADEPELVAENVRLALRAIGRITGRVELDELLDVVFRDFCIGK